MVRQSRTRKMKLLRFPMPVMQSMGTDEREGPAIGHQIAEKMHDKSAKIEQRGESANRRCKEAQVSESRGKRTPDEPTKVAVTAAGANPVMGTRAAAREAKAEAKARRAERKERGREMMDPARRATAAMPPRVPTGQAEAGMEVGTMVGGVGRIGKALRAMVPRVTTGEANPMDECHCPRSPQGPDGTQPMTAGTPTGMDTAGVIVNHHLQEGPGKFTLWWKIPMSLARDPRDQNDLQSLLKDQSKGKRSRPRESPGSCRCHGSQWVHLHLLRSRSRALRKRKGHHLQERSLPEGRSAAAETVTEMSAVKAVVTIAVGEMKVAETEMLMEAETEGRTKTDRGEDLQGRMRRRIQPRRARLGRRAVAVVMEAMDLMTAAIHIAMKKSLGSRSNRPQTRQSEDRQPAAPGHIGHAAPSLAAPDREGPATEEDKVLKHPR